MAPSLTLSRKALSGLLTSWGEGSRHCRPRCLSPGPRGTGAEGSLEHGSLWRPERDMATLLLPKDLHRPVGAEGAGEGEVVLPEERQGKEVVVHQVTRQVVVGPHLVGEDGHLGAEVGLRVAEAVAPQGRLGDQVGRREARPAVHTDLEEDRLFLGAITGPRGRLPLQVRRLNRARRVG